MTEKPLKILYEDNHLLIVHKPAGYLSQGDNTRDRDMIQIVKAYIKEKYEKPGAVYLGLPHRLDRPVSGALIFCKTSKAMTRMTDIFKKRDIKKVYHAIVLNRPQVLQKRIVSYLKKDAKRNRAIVSAKPFAGAKEAILNYQQTAEIDGSVLLEVVLETGRPHQIRAQLNQEKLPILGDLKYYPQKPLEDKSIALHAVSLEFIHPVKKVPVRIDCAYPKKPWWNKFS